MLLILLYWTYVLAFVSVAGHGIIRLCCGRGKIIPFIYYPLAGMAALAAFNSYVSLFTGLGGWIVLAELCLTTVYAAFHAKAVWADFFRQKIIALPLLSAAVLITGLAYQAIIPRTYDEGLYYLQAMHWIREYGIVPGLGNLHGRLAFNSSWHVLAAFFQLPQIYNGGFDDINGLLYVLIGLYSLSAVKELQKGITLSGILKASMLLPSLLFYRGLMAPAPDLVVTYYTWLTVILFTETFGHPDESWRIRLILLFTAFLVTVKLSSAIILLLPLYLLFRHFSWKLSRYAALVFLLILSPWIARNILLSGYLVYPVAATQVDQVDWQVPPEMARMEALAIRSYAKIPHVDYEVVDHMTVRQWLPRWWSNKKPDDKALLLLTLLSIPFLLLVLTIRFREIAGILTFLYVALSIAFWFATAPDPRFAYGPLWFMCVLAVFYLLRLLHRVTLPPGFIYFLLAGALALQWITLVFLAPATEVVQHMLLPAPVPVVQVSSENAGGHPVYIPEKGNQCWDAELPCSPIPGKHLEWRGESLRDGFRTGK